MHLDRLLLFGLTLTLADSVPAHAVFDAPRQFQRSGAGPGLDLRPQAEGFVRYAHYAVEQSAQAVTRLQKAINKFLAEPNAQSLDQVRQAWRDARPYYQRTEMLRFFNGPIDHPAGPGIAAGPEPRINAWPLNEAAIDAVRGAPRSGLVYASQGVLTEDDILRADQTSDEADVTTGWHAIEFLLWGQDFNATGPGQRPYTDFLPGDPYRERRRRYLQLLVERLNADLAQQEQAWDAEHADTYAHWLLQQPAGEILGRGIHGAASLAAIEIYGQRLTAPLDSGSQEDEHSCFSDHTLSDLRANLQGIDGFVRARYGDTELGASLIDLLRWKDPRLADRLDQALHRAAASLAAVPEPFDQILLSPGDAPARTLAEAAAEDVRLVAVALKAAAEALSLEIVVPGV